MDNQIISGKEKDRPRLFIPIETKVREFQAKLLLGCHAADAGFHVIIGEQVELLRRMKYMPPGVYMEKSAVSTKVKSMRMLRRLGNRVVAWCEEGLVILDPEAYARDRISMEILSEIDLFFAWGHNQADAITGKMPDAREKVVLSGNPRFDLHRDPYRACFSPQEEKIRSAYSPFFLINTNFGKYNSYFGSDYVIDKLLDGHNRILNEGHRAFLEGWRDHCEKIFRSFIEAVKQLSSEFPSQRIIVRPHPSENHDVWKDVTQGLPNVKVVHEGNVIPWIMASEALIHNGCTTGVEGYLLGKPVVSYRPYTSEDYEPELPILVSINVFSEKELHGTLHRILEEGDRSMDPIRYDEGVQGRLGKYFATLNGTYASENIVQSLVRLADRIDFNGTARGSSFFDRAYGRSRDLLIDLKSMLAGVIKGRSSYAAYRLQKFEGLNIEEFQEGIRLFREITDRFEGVRVQKMSGTKYCFSMTRI